MKADFDFLVVGAGIAGTSVAAELAGSARVAILEREERPGYHATGRSAAFFAASYGSDVVRGISAASEHFFRNPPDGFSEVPLLRPRDSLFIARADQWSALQQMRGEIPSLQALSSDQACRQVPILNRGYVEGALRDGNCGDLDVDAILQGYLRQFRDRGGQLKCNTQLESLHFDGQLWMLRCGDGFISAPVVVNAAGAWAGKVGELAGISGLGLQPMQRTAVLIDPNKSANQGEKLDVADWPLVVDIDEHFYFKPDAGLLLISPADESPRGPCDAQPEELDIAIAIDRFQKATQINVQRVEHSWAGLRTFSPDRNFIVGFDPRITGFFWLAGQGGYGVQSAPGLSQLTNSLLTGATLSADFSPVLSFREEVAPDRFL
ncbi:MAG: FAD-binding oxidoreductase [Gammaproteobacteria bacterium]|jgi:D-arginine dehydrogenase